MNALQLSARWQFSHKETL